MIFTANALVGPMVAGFVYLKRRENEVINAIRGYQQEVQPIIEELVEACKRLVFRCA